MQSTVWCDAPVRRIDRLARRAEENNLVRQNLFAVVGYRGAIENHRVVPLENIIVGNRVQVLIAHLKNRNDVKLHFIKRAAVFSPCLGEDPQSQIF